MPEPTLKQLRKDAFDYWCARHLLCRAGFGGTPGQVRALANLGLGAAVDHIVDYDDQPYDPVTAAEFDADIMRPLDRAERQRLQKARRASDEATVEQFRRERQSRQRADRQQMTQLQQWWMRRMIETPRPLEEKMTLFWHGHFATGYRAIENSYHMFRQNQMFRSHATGSFADLAHGIVRDPAMLRYLNNNQNRKQKPNENLARELMELFTLGEGNAYTERDIKEGARALTGYTFEDDAFEFCAAAHDDGSKRILGRVGRWDGDDFVDIILDRRETSEYICLKLYRFFVNDLPNGPDKATQGFIRRLAKQFRESEYDVKAILRTLFRSEHFYDDANVAAQIKSPVQLVVQALRSLRTPVRSLQGLAGATDLMGQNIFFPPSVKGWDGGRSWINTATLFVRQNLMIYLLTGRRPDQYAWETDGAPYDGSHLIEHLRDDDGRVDPEEATRYLLRFNLGLTPHPERVATIVRYFRDCGDRLDADVLTGALALIAAMPEYQLC